MRILEQGQGYFIYINESQQEVIIHTGHFLREAIAEAINYGNKSKIRLALKLNEVIEDDLIHSELIMLLENQHRAGKRGDSQEQTRRVDEGDFKVWLSIWYYHGLGYPLRNDATQESTACYQAAQEHGVTYEQAVAIYKRRGSKKPKIPNFKYAMEHMYKVGLMHKKINKKVKVFK